MSRAAFFAVSSSALGQLAFGQGIPYPNANLQNFEKTRQAYVRDGKSIGVSVEAEIKCSATWNRALPLPILFGYDLFLNGTSCASLPKAEVSVISGCNGQCEQN